MIKRPSLGSLLPLALPCFRSGKVPGDGGSDVTSLGEEEASALALALPLATQAFRKQMSERSPLPTTQALRRDDNSYWGLRRGSEPPVDEQEFSRQCKINGALSASAGVSMNCGPAACLWQMECTEYQRAVIQKKTDFDKF